MPNPPPHSQTTSQLLAGLFDTANTEVWSQFDARYRPIILGVVLRLGLRPEDAADVAQQVLFEFVRDYRLGKYNRDKGRLRSWIAGIARNRAIDLLNAERRARIGRGESAIVALPDQHTFDQAWTAEERRAVLNEAKRRLREHSGHDEATIRAFEMVVERKIPAETAAAECGLSIASVYQAKARIAEKLRSIIEQVEAEFVDPA
ncbi:MAG: sigma-70 family RNA polymerase sigma factor [Phycisphaerales bacterium]|nr:sigma-70 family RNA polymerase sigma factor [Phycisphaerales bacterium]